MPDDYRAGKHIYVLLDKSGSMTSMTSKVIDGFNGLLREQREVDPMARLTLVRFSGNDPFEIAADATPVAAVLPLSETSFVPGGSTPLFDAMAEALLHASERVAVRADGGKPRERVLFATLTDGHENASEHVGGRELRELVERETEKGIAFAHLGAPFESFAYTRGQVGAD